MCVGTQRATMPETPSKRKSVRRRRSSTRSPACKDMSHLKKYRTRKSPAYPANKCCGERKYGKDGLYVSTPNYRGICAWHKA